MHIYSTGQWVLLFFFYCFCGWVWESCYVSACQRRWVNRGFLHGPLLPIYGSGAIIILFVTLPAERYPALVWILGLIAATALEYVTGAVMERLFRVRYWDYSKHRFNVSGYICLSSSIAWGFFSLLLVYGIHPPVGRLLADLPAFLVDPLALVMTAAFTADVMRSVQEALDLRETLLRLTEENEELRRLARRAEVAAAFAEDDLRRFREKTDLDAQHLRQRVESYLRQEAQARENRRLRRREIEELRLRQRTQARMEILDAISDALESARARAEGPGEALERRKAELSEALERVRQRRDREQRRSIRSYRSSLRLLRDNPTAHARGLDEALDALRSLSDKFQK